MNHETDVCIVGAGPAGGILASVLARLDHDVIVLDAGPRFDFEDREERMERFLRPTFDRTDVWDMGGERDAYATSGARAYPLNEMRVKGIGGSSLLWRGTAMRLHPEDFEMRSQHGVAEDWPISYDDLAPYYLAAEYEMGVAGEEYEYGPPRHGGFPLPAHPPSRMDTHLADAFAAVGAELHPCPQAINSEPYDDRSECAGYGTCTPVCPSGAKYSADVHVERAEEAGARVIDRAPVQRLHHDDAGERIVSAEFVREGETGQVNADLFVLAAGSIESARLLLLSETDAFPDGLANGSEQVGRNFTDHQRVGLTAKIDETTGSDQIGFQTSISEAFYAHDEGPEGSIILQVDNVTGRAPGSTALRRQTNTNHLMRGDPVTPLQNDMYGDELLETVREEYQNRVRVEAVVEQLPHEDNQVGLDRSTEDDHGNPVPDVSYRVDDRTRETLERAQEVLYEILEAAGAYEIEPIADPDDPHFVGNQMGTTRMGTDPDESVVTPELRTHELENLYISSSGTFVTCGAVPPTLTIAALTLRLANHLHRRIVSS